MGLREQKKERTRQRILETAERMLRERGYAGTHVREIAAALELSPQTLYNYFASKEGILTALYTERMNTIAGAVDELRVKFLENPDAPGTQVERFLHMIRWGLRAMARDRAFMKIIFLNAAAARGTAVDPGGARDDARELLAPQRANDRALDAMFESMQKSGELRTDVEPGEMRDLYTMVFSRRVTEWLSSDDEDVETLERSVIGGLEIVFRGLRAF